MSKKLKVGIDINEVFRAKWLQFDRYYSQEFQEDGSEEEISPNYCYDFFKGYEWHDTVEIIKELKEPDSDFPDDINPAHYQVDENGEADADAFLFKKAEEKRLTAREVYNRFMYEDYVFEIHASAPIMYKGMDLHAKNFYLKYGEQSDFTLFSVENQFSIPSTMFFLSRMTSRFKTIKFIDKNLEMWDDIDVLITTDPEILSLGAPWGKKLIKLTRPYNEKIKGSSLEVLQINDLIDNPDFEKIIKYKKQ
jgi:hypothetical protein